MARKLRTRVDMAQKIAGRRFPRQEGHEAHTAKEQNAETNFDSTTRGSMVAPTASQLGSERRRERELEDEADADSRLPRPQQRVRLVPVGRVPVA
jgi:hypothetical protein